MQMNMVKKLQNYIDNNLPKMLFYAKWKLTNIKNKRTNLTLDRSYYKIEDQKHTIWNEYTNFSKDCESSSNIEKYPNLERVLEDYVECFIFIDEYCPEIKIDLIKELIKFYTKYSKEDGRKKKRSKSKKKGRSKSRKKRRSKSKKKYF
jgi:hypothetical protein